MQTDIPLKRLTALCGADLLPLLGFPYAELLSVKTEELPATTTRLDNVLHVRSPQGQEYLHVLEWQGYYDALVLRRLAQYIIWEGQENPTLPVVGTIIYLAPVYDVGDTLTQKIDDQVVQSWKMHAIRLWEQDAQAAVASGKAGLAILSPLMSQANSGLVERALDIVLTQAPRRQQNELLSILGTFAEPFINPKRFVQLVGRERLMESKLFNYLMEEKIAETEARHQTEIDKLKIAMEELQREKAVQEFRQGLEETLILRFPHVSPVLLLDIRQVSQPATLRQLLSALNHATDLAAFEQALKQTIASS